MEDSKIKTVVDSLTGPGSALVVLAFIVYGLASYIPSIVERHFSLVDRMMEQHETDRDVYQKTMTDLTEEIRQLGNRIQ